MVVFPLIPFAPVNKDELLAEPHGGALEVDELAFILDRAVAGLPGLRTAGEMTAVEPHFSVTVVGWGLGAATFPEGGFEGVGHAMHLLVAGDARGSGVAADDGAVLRAPVALSVLETQAVEQSQGKHEF